MVETPLQRSARLAREWDAPSSGPPLIRRIASLCDFTGEWSRPYREAGYDVVQIDLKRGGDVRTLAHLGAFHGVLAAPPCTMFANSGARWKRTHAEMLDALSIVDACLRVVAIGRPKWWALENPIGKLRRYLGPPAFSFDPCDFGDPYTKKTLLWGEFKAPTVCRVEPTEGSKMHLIPPGPDRQAIRSVTPAGFARAFFEANP